MIQIMTRGLLHAVYHTGPQAQKYDTNYNTCSVCQHTTSAKKNIVQITMHNSERTMRHNLYHLFCLGVSLYDDKLINKKDDANYGA